MGKLKIIFIRILSAIVFIFIIKKIYSENLPEGMVAILTVCEVVFVYAWIKYENKYYENRKKELIAQIIKSNIKRNNWNFFNIIGFIASILTIIAFLRSC